MGASTEREELSVTREESGLCLLWSRLRGGGGRVKRRPILLSPCDAGMSALSREIKD